MTTLDTNINDHMTKVQLRLLRQKLQEEKARASRASSRSSSNGHQGVGESDVQLQRAMLRRQELLDRIKHEQSLNDDLYRPRSFTGRRDRLTPPPSRRAGSQPADFRPGDTPRHVIEHQFRPIRLEPMDNAPRPPPPPSVVHTTTVPQPYIVNAAPPEPKAPPVNSKAEMYELMMMQNAQMHQMVMQQLMMSAIPKPQQPATEPHKRLTVDLDDIVSMSDKKRPSSVHHHHYSSSAPPPTGPPAAPPAPVAPPVAGSYPYSLPPVTVHPGHTQMMPYYQSPRYYPAEMEPLKVPRVRKQKSPRKPEPKVETKKKYGPLPFPGPWALRKFRHAAYAVFFSKVLQKSIKKRRPAVTPKSNKDFLFGIKLKEAIAALHNIYLNTHRHPEKKMQNILRQVVTPGARDLSLSMTSDASSSDKSKAINDLAVVVENVIFEMTDIMPGEPSVLGTHRKAVTYQLIQPGNLFPRGYLWQIEKDLLKFDDRGRTRDVSDYDAYVMLVGLFIGRGIMTTLLLKPIEYGLTSDQLTYNGEKNLKIVATLFVYLLRYTYASNKKELPPLPFEISRYLHSDEEMKEVYKKLKNSIEYAEGLLRPWGREYVKRLRDAL